MRTAIVVPGLPGHEVLCTRGLPTRLGPPGHGCRGTRQPPRCPRVSPPTLVASRCFKLTCRAMGVHPPLELSHYQIKFAATSLYDTSVATLYVINSHVSVNALIHSVPRVGSEEACPVGPTSFEFLLSPDLPITISPSVGTVCPGKVGAGPTSEQGPEPLGVPGSAGP